MGAFVATSATPRAAWPRPEGGRGGREAEDAEAEAAAAEEEEEESEGEAEAEAPVTAAPTRREGRLAVCAGEELRPALA